MAYEHELFFGSLFVPFGFRFTLQLPALLEPKLSAIATADTHAPRESARSMSRADVRAVPSHCTFAYRACVPLVRRVRRPVLVCLSALLALGVYWAVHAALGADTTRAATSAFGFFVYAVDGLGVATDAPAVVAPVVVIAARTAAADEQQSEAGYGNPLVARTRAHHLYSDTMADLYYASHCVFFSHIGWLLLWEHSRVLQVSRRFVSVADVCANLLLALQEHLDSLWNLAWCSVLPTLVPVVL